jgi:tetratricopeptide (TPR) repeat protein
MPEDPGMHFLSSDRMDDPNAAVDQLTASRLSALSFDDEEVRSIYNAGIGAYQRYRYEQAGAIFHFVCLLRPAQQEYVFALGLALKMAGEYDRALPVFLLAGALAEPRFESQLHAVECLLHLQQTAQATYLLQVLIRDASPDVNPDWLARAQAWLQLAQGGSENAGHAR